MKVIFKEGRAFMEIKVDGKLMERECYRNMEELPFCPFEPEVYIGERLMKMIGGEMMIVTDCIHPDCECLDYCEGRDPYSTPKRKTK